jgi:hypothetical protein
MPWNVLSIGEKESRMDFEWIGSIVLFSVPCSFYLSDISWKDIIASLWYAKSREKTRFG